MGKKDPRVDAYIKKAAEFARPILEHLRELIHRGCPEVEETFKWSMPSFVYKGLLCGMAAFKEHAAFGLWKHDLVVGSGARHDAMGQFGRITSLKDLPPDDIMLQYIRKGAALNDAGVKTASRPRAKRALEAPDFFMAALRKNKRAESNFARFSYSHKKEYVDWIRGAKREETRQKRLATALAWITQGKPQNWKYMQNRAD